MLLVLIIIKIFQSLKNKTKYISEFINTLSDNITAKRQITILANDNNVIGITKLDNQKLIRSANEQVLFKRHLIICMK